MTAFNLDIFEQGGLNIEKIDIGLDKIRSFNKFFNSGVIPNNGVYGSTEVLKDNGVLEKISKNSFGFTRKEYLRDDQLIRVREKISDSSWNDQLFDDNSTHYMTKTYVKNPGGSLTMESYSLTPGVTVVKNNFTSQIDHLGRPVLNKVTDLQLSPGRGALSSKLRDSSYLDTDERGHIIADIFDGPATKENVVPQDYYRNRVQMKSVENIVKDLKQQGHTVDYEVKTNYIGNSTRPSSFEPRITVDGKPYNDLPKDLQKIINVAPDKNVTSTDKIIRSAEESLTKAAVTVKPYHDTGVKVGGAVAAATFVKSTVENTTLLYKGEISAEEMATNIVKDTASGGLAGYGTGFISSAVADKMKNSSHELIKSVGNIKVPGEALAFAVMSFDSVVDYAQGDIEGRELAYDLGDNAASIIGGKVGFTLATAAVGAVTTTAGTAAAGAAAVGVTATAPVVVPTVAVLSVGILGSMVGTAVATEIYETAMTTDFENIDQYAATVKECANQAIDAAREYAPAHVEDVKASLNQFAQNVNLPFSLI